MKTILLFIWKRVGRPTPVRCHHHQKDGIRKQKEMKLDLEECIVGSLENVEDLMGDVSIEDIVRRICRVLPERLNFRISLEEEGTSWLRRRKEHLEAEKNLRGKQVEEPKMAKRELTKQI